MQYSSLVAFLDGKRPAEDFWREIELEVRQCLNNCAKHSSGSVIFTGGQDTRLTRKRILVLLEALTDGEIPLEAASYIADAIIMSHNFEPENEAVLDAMHLLADDSAPMTLAQVKEARSLVA